MLRLPHIHAGAVLASREEAKTFHCETSSHASAAFLQHSAAANSCIGSTVTSTSCAVSLSSRCFGNGAGTAAVGGPSLCRRGVLRAVSRRGLTSSAVLRARDLHLRAARNGSLSGHGACSERARSACFSFGVWTLERVVLQCVSIKWAQNGAGGLVTVERNWRSSLRCPHLPAHVYFTMNCNSYEVHNNTKSTLPKQTPTWHSVLLPTKVSSAYENPDAAIDHWRNVSAMCDRD